MKYAIPSFSRGRFVKHAMPLAVLIGVLAASPWPQAQAGGNSGSVGGVGTELFE